MNRSDQLFLEIESQSSGYEPVREMFSQNLDIKYDGWCNSFDKQFDCHSRFFLLYCGDELIAGLRLVLSDRSSSNEKLPVELARGGDKLQLSQYHSVGEYSGFWFSELKYGIAICAIANEWAMRFLPNHPIFAIYEEGNKGFKTHL